MLQTSNLGIEVTASLTGRGKVVELVKERVIGRIDVL